MRSSDTISDAAHGEKPSASSALVALKMSRQRQKDTAAELCIRSLLFRQGLRYRTEYRIAGSRCRIDIAFPRQRLAIFIDGCFWHSCPSHSSIPKKNTDWWREKLLSNARRDKRTTDHLHALGWTVLRFWEHEIPELVAASIVDAFRTKRIVGREALQQQSV